LTREGHLLSNSLPPFTSLFIYQLTGMTALTGMTGLTGLTNLTGLALEVNLKELLLSVMIFLFVVVAKLI